MKMLSKPFLAKGKTAIENCPRIAIGRKIKVESDNQLYETYELKPDTFSLLGQVIAALPLRMIIVNYVK